MKNFNLTFVLIIFLILSKSITAQVGSTVLGNNQVGVTFLPGEKDKIPNIDKIKHKTYLTQNYEQAFINGIKESVFLKYNIYKDEMEFVKNETTYYLNKKEGTSINFKRINTTYKIYDYKNKFRYFQVHNDDKALLLSKQNISYIEAKPAATSYQKAKPADFRRESDSYYIKFQNQSIKELPSKKKNFYQIFGEKSNSIKSFVKKNKIDIKKIKDLKEVINYYNTL